MFDGTFKDAHCRHRLRDSHLCESSPAAFCAFLGQPHKHEPGNLPSEAHRQVVEKVEQQFACSVIVQIVPDKAEVSVISEASPT